MAYSDGNVVSYNGGKFCIRVYTDYTDDAIKMKMAVRITDDFKDKQKKFTFSYEKPNGKTWKKVYSSKDFGAKSTGIYYPLGQKWYSNTDYQTKVSLTIGNKTSRVTLTSNIKPAKATDINAKYNNDSNISVTMTLHGKAAKPIRTVHLYRKDDYGLDTDDNRWTEISSYTYPAGTTGGLVKDDTITMYDQTTEKGHRYRYAIVTENQAGATARAYMSKYKGSEWVYTQPNDVSDVSHVRIDDRQNTIQFSRENQDVDREIITGVIIERSESDGEWISVGTSGVGTASGPTTITYTDNTATPDNSYSYRVRPFNSQLKAETAIEIGGTEKTYNTPAPPVDFIATYKNRGNPTTSHVGDYVLLKLTNRPKTADNTEIQKSIDGGATWTTLVDDEGVLTEYTDPNISSSMLYRARNVRTDPALSSAYIVSNAPETLSTPNPPTIVTPFSGTPMIIGDTMHIAWIHNPTDGTAQRWAQLEYKINDGSYTTLTALETYYDLALNPATFSPNDVLTIRIKTKGEYNRYSDYSYLTIPLYTKPQLTITSPQNSDTIGNLPLNLSFTYTDNSGTLAGLNLKIMHDGVVVNEEALDVSETSFELSDFLFDNNEYYQLQLTALSSSGLSASDSVSVYIDYDIVTFKQPWYVDADVDEENGIVSFNVSEGQVSTDPEALDVTVARATIYRVVNCERIKVADVGLGEQIVDFYAPLNIDFDYEILEQATTGEIMVLTQSYNLESILWYVYYGLNNEKIARAQWEPQGDVALTRPEREQIRYSGRTYPVTYDSTALGETYSFKCIITDRNELNHFIEMMREGGHGIWKSGNGECYDADLEFSYSAEYKNATLQWDCTLSVTRTEE